jgi:hypothetical protein
MHSLPLLPCVSASLRLCVKPFSDAAPLRKVR